MKTYNLGNTNGLKYKDREFAMLNKRYSKIKYRHKKVLKSDEEVICFRQFKIVYTSKCFYCNAEHSFVLKDINEHDYKTKISNEIVKCNGIDRINSSRGYTKSNVVSCCSSCNKAKQEMTTIEFYKYCLTLSGRINNFSMIKNKLKNRTDEYEISRRYGKTKSRHNELEKRNKYSSDMLSKEEFKKYIFSDCYYCKTNHTAINLDTGTKFNGLDRLDNSKGYEEGNVITCCVYCNKAKSELSIKNFYRMINRIVKKLTKKK